MDGMTDLVTWLRVQLDEDDAVIARNRGQAGLGDEASYPDYQTYDGSDIDAACDYLGQFPPPRMAAEVEAKRRMLDWIEQTWDRATDCDYFGVDREQALGILALPYGDRPGFDPQWAIAAAA